jgi:hypothetical protein
VEYEGLVEFKYIKRDKTPPSQQKIDTLLVEAKEQLNLYQRDEIVQEYLNNGLKLQCVVIIFWGWEMLYCEKIS